MKFRLFGIMQLGLWIRTEPQMMPSGLPTVFLTLVTSLPKLDNPFRVFPDSRLMLMSVHHLEILFLWMLMLLSGKPAVLFLAIHWTTALSLIDPGYSIIPIVVSLLF